jgi:hypothetical protein
MFCALSPLISALSGAKTTAWNYSMRIQSIVKGDLNLKVAKQIRKIISRVQSLFKWHDKKQVEILTF